MKLVKVRWKNPELLLDTETGTGIIKRNDDGTLSVLPYSELFETFLAIESTGDLVELLEFGDIVTHDADEFSTADHNHNGLYEPLDATILKEADVVSTPEENSTSPLSAGWAFRTLMTQNYMLSGC